MIPPPRKVTSSYKGKVYVKWRVSYVLNGKRIQKNYDSESEAKRAHRQITADLIAGNQIFSHIQPADVREYLDAKELLQGGSVFLAVKELVELKESCPVPLTLAVEEAKKSLRPVMGVPVRESIKGFLATKDGMGLSPRHIKDLESRLGRFAKAHTVRTDLLSVDDLCAWIRQQGSPVSMINHTRILKSWIQWAITRGQIHQSFRLDDLPRIRRPVSERHIYTPEEMESILAQATPQEMPLIIFGGFCGLRSSEVARLKWEEVGETSLRVVTHKGSAKSRRLVPIPGNAQAWIAANRGVGKVTTSFQYYRRTWESKPNALRHSAISYRVALTGDVERVALENGNSPSIIYSNYLELVTKEDAERWFGIPLVPA